MWCILDWERYPILKKCNKLGIKSNKRADIVLFNQSNRTVHVIELKKCWDRITCFDDVDRVLALLEACTLSKGLKEIGTSYLVHYQLNSRLELYPMETLYRTAIDSNVLTIDILNQLQIVPVRKFVLRKNPERLSSHTRLISPDTAIRLAR